jgi:sialic acid synthase SpsE
MTQIIAEVGANHLGRRDMIVAYAKECNQRGIHICKFQGWRADTLDKERYDEIDRFYYQQREIDFMETVDICTKARVQPLITCFDIKSMSHIALAMGYSDRKIVKIASPDMLSFGLIEKGLELFDEVIISTGMHSTQEIYRLATYLKTIKAERKVVLLHCVSNYPTNLRDVHMARAEHLVNMGFRWGFSDHTTDNTAAIIAIARGAEYVEKHVSFSGYLDSRDAHMSTTFDKLEELVEFARLAKLAIGERDNKYIQPWDVEMRERYCGKWGDNS